MHLIFLFILLRKLLESFSLVPQGPENLHQGQRLLGGSSHMANTLGGKDPPADGQCLGSSSSLCRFWAVLNPLGSLGRRGWICLKWILDSWEEAVLLMKESVDMESSSRVTV